MRIYLWMGSVLIAGLSLLVGPASGQERKPSTPPPGPDRGPAPGPTMPMDPVRMADVAIMQAAAEQPVRRRLASRGRRHHSLDQIRWNEYLRTTKFFPELDPEGYMQGKNMPAGCCIKLSCGGRSGSAS